MNVTSSTGPSVYQPSLKPADALGKSKATSIQSHAGRPSAFNPSANFGTKPASLLKILTLAAGLFLFTPFSVLTQPPHQENVTPSNEEPVRVNVRPMEPLPKGGMVRDWFDFAPEILSSPGALFTDNTQNPNTNWVNTTVPWEDALKGKTAYLRVPKGVDDEIAKLKDEALSHAGQVVKWAYLYDLAPLDKEALIFFWDMAAAVLKNEAEQRAIDPEKLAYNALRVQQDGNQFHYNPLKLMGQMALMIKNPELVPRPELSENSNGYNIADPVVKEMANVILLKMQEKSPLILQQAIEASYKAFQASSDFSSITLSRYEEKLLKNINNY